MIRPDVSRRNKTTRYGQPPPERARTEPKQRGVGAVPNPRRPRLVSAVDGGVLKDLFAIFPDLPRPARPAPRVRHPDERAPIARLRSTH